MKIPILRFALSIVLILLLFSCASHKRLNYMQDPGNGVQSYPDTSFLLMDYSIQIGDELRFTIYILDEESKLLFQYFNPYISNNQSNQNSYLLNFPVHQSGTIEFPYLGTIAVLGKSLKEVKKEIENRLSEITYLPQVEVTLANNYYSVVGEATNGKFKLPKEHTTIYQALAISGDMKTYADRAKVKIIRQTANGTIIRSFDLRSKDILHTEYYYIQPNDVIYVQPYSGQFFGFDTFTTIFGVVTSAVSIVLLILGLIK